MTESATPPEAGTLIATSKALYIVLATDAVKLAISHMDAEETPAFMVLDLTITDSRWRVGYMLQSTLSKPGVTTLTPEEAIAKQDASHE